LTHTFLLCTSEQRDRAESSEQKAWHTAAQTRLTGSSGGRLINMAWFWGQIGHVALVNKVVGGAHVSAKRLMVRLIIDKTKHAKACWEGSELTAVRSPFIAVIAAQQRLAVCGRLPLEIVEVPRHI
jgi:hypothetical protein